MQALGLSRLNRLPGCSPAPCHLPDVERFVRIEKCQLTIINWCQEVCHAFGKIHGGEIDGRQSEVCATVCAPLNKVYGGGAICSNIVLLNTREQRGSHAVSSQNNFLRFELRAIGIDSLKSSVSFEEVNGLVS